MSGAQPITVAILGAGGRGQGFAQIIGEMSHLAQVVAVAEPRDAYRQRMVENYRIPDAHVFTSWQEFIAQPKLCDAVVISTMDRDHAVPAIACLEKGYHLLLEKPMATTLEDCQAIAAAGRNAGTIGAVCHSLRYNKGFSKVKELIDAGRIGRLITIDQLEQVAYWHQAHSFVRGNWGNEGRSTFMLLAKSCHDIDYIAYLTGQPCRQVSSFGALTYFTPESAPPGSTARCTDGCPAESTCPYSAIKWYVQGNRETWPGDMVSPVHTYAAHLEAIKTGPYGRCVYQTDNDVVDHQVVMMEFDGDITATFTMTAFTQGGGRKIRVHGTQGEIEFSEGSITLRTFGDENVEVITPGQEIGGHGGGDTRVVRNWLEAIRTGDNSLVLTDLQESLRTHTIVFAAEQARREKRLVSLAEFQPAAAL
ncbi:MAG TPA: Gfo/Idh/MocA family oxidoreductase [Armatimonadota bacterium]|jgi:predicted dehydrogenase